MSADRPVTDRLNSVTILFGQLLEHLAADRKAPVIYLDAEDYNDLAFALEQEIGPPITAARHDSPNQFASNGILIRRRIRNPHATAEPS